MEPLKNSLYQSIGRKKRWDPAKVRRGPNSKERKFLLFSGKGRENTLSCSRQCSSGHRQEEKIRAGKHGIQAVFVFLQAPVSDFPIAKLTFDDAENMLHFAANGGFALFNIAVPVNGVAAHFGKLAGAEVDAVIDGG